MPRPKAESKRTARVTSEFYEHIEKYQKDNSIPTWFEALEAYILENRPIGDKKHQIAILSKKLKECEKRKGHQFVSQDDWLPHYWPFRNEEAYLEWMNEDF